MQQATLPGGPPPLVQLLSETRIALFLDFDGTLVDIAPSPDAIRVPQGLEEHLLALHEALEGRLALVSGRSIADLGRHLRPVPIARAGSHGAECVLGNGRAIADLPPPVPEDLQSELGQLAELHQGLEIERKTFGVGLHFRAAPDLADAITERGKSLADAYGMTVKQGKCVVELMTAQADKGAAVRRFMGTDEFSGSKPVFIGDDVTDEDGFEVCTELGGYGVAVGERPSQNARYHLASTGAVREWLKL